MKRVLFVALLVLVAIVGAYRYNYPTYSYRYRLTVNVVADGKIRSGSSVIEVSWSAFFVPGYHFNPELGGEAALVDLGPHGVVVGTLINGESYGPALDETWGAIWIVPRAFGIQTGSDQLPALEKARGRRDLAANNLPRLVWLSNPSDPMTAQKVSAQDFPALIGPTVRFAGASVEITDDPIVIDIRGKLPWLGSLKRRPPEVIYLRDGFPISRALFIGDAS